MTANTRRRAPGGGRKPRLGVAMTTTIKARVPADRAEELQRGLYDLRDGAAALFAVDAETDWPLVAWLRERAAEADAAHDLALADNLAGLAGVIEAALRLQRQRDRDEFRASIEEAGDE